MKKNNGFGLFGVIIIIIVTAIVASIATGVIMLNNSKTNINMVSKDEDLQAFLEFYETIVDNYYDDIDKEAMFDAAEKGMIDYLGDKYTTLLDDSEYHDIVDDLKENYTGIGIEVSNNIIVSVIANSPAEKMGLQANDIILKVNSIDVTNMMSEEIAKIIKESNNDYVSLEIKRNEAILNFNVKKELLENQAIKYEIKNNDIGYLNIKKFSEKLDVQVSKALKDMEQKGIKGLIIDVRDNVGGYLLAAEDTASLFLEKGKIIYGLESSFGSSTYKDETNESRNYPIVVLINKSSASASEILAAALKESYGATLVGTKSYGKGKVQRVYPLSNGNSIKSTTAKWLTPNGNCIDEIGIAPDYSVENPEEQLQKALSLLEMES